MSFPRKSFYDGITYFKTDWDELQDNIGNYYDALISTMQGDISAIEADYLTSAHKTEADPHPNIDLDYIKQGTTYKKITAVEKALYDSGYYDILDLTTTVKFGHGGNVTAFYFAKGGDDDGANIYAKDIYSRGCPVYILVFDSGWHNIGANGSKGSTAHGLGYRPDFGILHVSASDPTGQPEEYVYTDGYAGAQVAERADSYGAWNDTYYNIYNKSPNSYYCRLLLFAYLGP